MPDLIGRQLGPYRVDARIGAGGMGEVYRARDTKLGRDVAIKVLPEAFAKDADRFARFTREAQTLAALNHPNIAHIHGLEESSDVRALVMELVEGDDLSVLIARGPMPLAEALPIAKQIAEALEAAHDLGIVHRDLKPANIKVRPDGTVKVLDFGLAKATDPMAGSGAEAMNSPTRTGRATQMGMIIGTAAYMSPEQARGKAVDKRADIWAFGLVLYEMLTGERAIKGDEVSDVLAAVLRQDINWAALPPATPARLRRLLERCLDRDVKERLRDIGEARVEVANIQGGAPDTAIGSGPGVPVRPSRLARVLPWSLAGTCGAALLGALIVWSPWRATVAPAASRSLLVSIGVDGSLPGRPPYTAAALSPDGTTLAFVAREPNETQRLFIRNLGHLKAASVPGTDGATRPFFSPDGRWVAFFAVDKLKKVAVAGGAPIELCAIPRINGGAWMSDDTIIFAPAAGQPLMRVPAGGGTPAVFGTFGPGAVTQRSPQALPGGRGVLYTEHSGLTGFGSANLVVAPLTGGPGKIVVRGAYFGRYMSSGPGSPNRNERAGHVLYMQHGVLVATGFDLDRLETIGEAVQALDGVTADPGNGFAQLAVSSEGTLVYVPGEAKQNETALDWMARDGKRSVLRAARVDWAGPRFSPDGKKIALDVSDGQQRDIWVYEWARDTLTRVTFDPGQDRGPVWTPDGRRIVFASDRAKLGVSNLYSVSADGTGQVRRLTDSPNAQQAYSWHPNGQFLAFHENRGSTRTDLMILPMDGDGGASGSPTVFLSTPVTEEYPMFSPDGRWIAYHSDENRPNYFDVYVRPFPIAEGKWLVSTAGALFPHWSMPSHDLLFVVPGARLMAAAYSVAGNSFRAEKPRPWSPAPIQGLPKSFQDGMYDLHPDDSRVALAAFDASDTSVQDKVVLISNFSDYLWKIAPGKK